MRWINIAVSVVFFAIILIFAFQNFQTVTVSFLDLRMSAPLAVLIAVIYLLGMVTGGSLWAFVRRALEGAKRQAS
jgi:uncharacterized integral membrane protein